jgi:hypothetical protein
MMTKKLILGLLFLAQFGFAQPRSCKEIII